MPDCLMQQDARPARPEHDGHAAGRRRSCIEIDERAAHGFVHQLLPAIVVREARESVTSTAARVALLAPVAVLHDHRYVHADQRPHIRSECAVARHHEHDFVRGRQAGHHLLDTRIDATRLDVHALEQLHFLHVAQTFERILWQIKLVAGRCTPRLQRARRAAARNRARRLGRFGQRRQHDLVGICETGLLARQRTHPDTLLHAVRAVLDDAVFKRPGLLAHQLEVQVGVVDAVPHYVAEHMRDAVLVQSRGRQDGTACELDRLVGRLHLRQIDVESVGSCAHEVRSLVTWNLRWESAGKRPRSSCCNVRSISATARPGPASTTRATT